MKRQNKVYDRWHCEKCGRAAKMLPFLDKGTTCGYCAHCAHWTWRDETPK